MNYLELSKEVSYALRHAPWEYELEMDEEGFVPIAQLLAALDETGHYERKITIEDLHYMMEASDKKRHEIVGDKIRALYGHSIPMHIRKEETIPPDVLYHGTAHKFMDSIMKNGLIPKGRQYVHLSMDTETALIVGKRRDDNPVLLEINAKQAYADGVSFYISNDKVWLSDNIPSKYIKIKY